MRRLGQALNVILLLAAPALLAGGIAKIAEGDTRLGVFAIFVACALVVGVGASVLQSWTGYEPGRQYLLGAVFIFGGMGGFSLVNAFQADDPIVIAVAAMAAAILLPFALLALYGWLRGANVRPPGPEG
jgi:hypothetical protein